jgi:hypothetical protein
MTINNTKAAILAMALPAFFAACNNPAPNTAIPAATNGLPQDVKVTCPLDSPTFNSWFVSGRVTENGAVQPANSVGFIHDSNCNFYRWAEQMFMWIMSPASERGYGNGGTVFESSVFYTVAPDTANNFTQPRMFIPHEPGKPIRVLPSFIQDGPNRLPVIKDKTGHLFEVENAKPAANAVAMVASTGGRPVAVHHVAENADGTLTFFDAKNNAIPEPKAMIVHKANSTHIVHMFTTTAGKKVFIDGNGKRVDAESGQATGDVLVAQNGSMVYYVIFANDVFAYLRTGVSAKQLDSTKFPTTAGGRDSICAFARSFNGATLPDSNALAIELKTSWIEASGLPDSNNYVKTTAIVPVYKKAKDSTWVYAGGERTARLALIGMHVVGSAAGHPEMIWATFEHQKSAPNAAYQYVDSKGNVQTVKQDSGAHWLLSNNASDAKPNVSHQHWSANNAADTIYGTSSSMTASNTLRATPWGSGYGARTNPEDNSSAASNSEVISINNAVYGMMKANDMRKNYLFIGATWTSGGAPPDGNSYSDTTSEAGTAIGTSALANASMETYLQGPTTTCFFCHSNNASLSPNALSHVFQFINPLPKTPPTMNK